MTQDEKVALLRQAGVWDVIGFPGCIDKLIDIVVAHEREACAKVAESIVTKQSKHINDGKPFYAHMYWEDIAAAIRTRGQK